MEYAKGGSLHSLIHEKQATLDINLIIKILKQIARALVYLHSSKPPIIHRNLNPKNIVLDRACNAKLTDFGLAKEIIPNSILSTSGKGTLRYMAPEQVAARPTEKSDVYTFGIILWELLTRNLPYPDAKNDVQIFEKMRNTQHSNFKFPDNTPPGLKEIGEWCLTLDKEKRPTSAETFNKLEQLFPNISSDNADIISNSNNNSDDELQSDPQKTDTTNNNSDNKTLLKISSQMDFIVKSFSTLLEDKIADSNDNMENYSTITNNPQQIPTTKASTIEQNSTK